MRLVEEVAEVVEQAQNERPLSAARDDIDAQSARRKPAHQFAHAVEDTRLRQLMEVARLDIIHSLCLRLIDLAPQLALHIVADRVHAPCPLCGIGVGLREMDSEVAHGTLPCLRMMGHTIIEHAVHIKQYGLGIKPFVAVLI